jgi:ribonuclease P protein component
MYVRKNGESINRVGVSVSKKVGNSVVRHRVKRLMKEAFRTSEDMFNSGLDIVFVAKKSAAEMSFDDAKKSLMDLAASHHILSKTGN